MNSLVSVTIWPAMFRTCRFSQPDSSIAMLIVVLPENGFGNAMREFSKVSTGKVPVPEESIRVAFPGNVICSLVLRLVAVMLSIEDAEPAGLKVMLMFCPNDVMKRKINKVSNADLPITVLT